MSLVNRAISSAEPWSEKLRQVQVERAAEEQVADVEQRPLHDVGDQHLLEEHEEALDRHADHDEAHQEQQAAKAVGREIL